MQRINYFQIIIVLALFLFTFFIPKKIFSAEKTLAKEMRMEAVVTKVFDENRVELIVTKGDLKNKKVVVETGKMFIVSSVKYKTGDKVILVKTNDQEKNFFYISEFIRHDSLYLLFAIFAGLTILIGRRRGLASLFGMLISFYIIFNLILSQIMIGQNPIIITILASLFIIPITFYLSHGINKKTTAAVIGTVISLILTSILAGVFIEAARLTGFASEEAVFIQSQMPGLINIKGLLYAGIIIGLLGILDDITISQAAIVYQLRKTSIKLTNKEIYSKAMDIGRDHIASMVNTLVLVYTGAAMPLLLLFINNPRPFADIINNEIVAEEIVRTLVASIGLILAVPITTFIASYLLREN